MKVLVYTTLFPNHLQPNNAIFIKQRMFHFARLSGCEIKVISPVPYFPAVNINPKWYQCSQIKSKEVIEGIEVFHPRYPIIPKISMPLHGFSLFVSSLKSIKRIHKTFSFDLIDGHYIYPDGLAAVLIGKLFKKPVVLSARGTDINQFPKFRSIRPMIRYALRGANRIIAVSNALKQEMANLGIEGEKIHVIPNGVDTAQFQPVDKDEARQELSIPNNSKIILSVGKLTPLKGFDILLEAFRYLAEQNSNTYLYIVGEGPQRPFLERRMRELNLAKHAFLAGEIPNGKLRMWYSAADLFCLASSREGWPNVLMESLACGTPVVSTRVGGTPEIITSPELGILVDRSAESIHHNLAKALGKIWDRSRIRAHVENRDWSTVANETKEIFARILDEEKGASFKGRTWV